MDVCTAYKPSAMNKCVNVFSYVSCSKEYDSSYDSYWTLTIIKDIRRACKHDRLVEVRPTTPYYLKFNTAKMRERERERESKHVCA